MATHDYVLDNATGANFRSDLNNALAAIVSNNSSSSEPSTKYAYQWWADTNEGVLKIRNSSNDGWVTLLQLDGTLTLEDGSASAPALGFRDDLNTGIFSSAADTLDISCGGTTRGSFSSSGLTVTGNVTATTFVGNIDAVDGDFDGTLEADAITVAGVALSTVIAGTTVTTATNANHVSVADNESTNENNLIPFIEDASATGNVGLESDGDFTYNPSTGTVTATKFVGETVLGDTSPQLGGDLDANGQNIAVDGGNNITIGDNGRLRLGASQDLDIYHDNTNSRSRIEHSTDNTLEILQGGNAGMLIQNQNSFNIEIKTNAEDAIKCIANGAVELYFDASKKFETSSSGVTITGDANWADNGKAEFGNAADLQIYHDGSNSRIHDDGTGVLAVSGSEILFQNAAQSETVAKFVQDAQCELYHNNTKRLETNSSGVNVIGTFTVDGSAISGGGSGKVLQVLTATANNSTTSSGSFQSTGCSVNITPANTANKVLAIASGGMLNTSAGSGGGATIFRDSSNLSPNNDIMGGYFGEDNSNNIEVAATFHVLDSPNTTSQVTYEIKVRAFSGTQGFGHRNTQRLTVIEIDGT